MTNAEAVMLIRRTATEILEELAKYENALSTDQFGLPAPDYVINTAKHCEKAWVDFEFN